VEAQEAVQRILFVYWRPIVALVLIGVVAGLALHVGEQPVYVASTRVNLASPDPQDAAQSQAIADAARAIVTSPSHVAGALDGIGASRDAAVVARDDVDLQALGTSGTMELTVRDVDPHVAARLADALASDLIATRLQVTQGASTETLRQEAAALRTKLDQVDARIDGLQAMLPGASAANLPTLSSQLASLDTERTSLIQQITTLQAQAQRAPVVIDPARAPDRAAPSRRPLDVALGALLGLVLGVAGAAVAETIRPTAVSARAVERVVGVPVLGELDARFPGDPARLGVVWLRLVLTIRKANVAALQLVGTGPPDELEALARALLDQERASPADGAPALPVMASPVNGRPGRAQALGGAVLVVRTPVKHAELAALAECVALTRGALLGVLTIRRVRWPGQLAGGCPGAGGRPPKPARSRDEEEKEVEVG
jgi:hypothetical protein